MAKNLEALGMIETKGFIALLEATDLAFADPWMYVADAPGVQVKMLRVVAPQKAQP